MTPFKPLANPPELLPHCFGSKPSPQAKAENDCETCPHNKGCLQTSTPAISKNAEDVKDAIEYITHSSFTIEASDYLSYKKNLNIIIKAAQQTPKQVEDERVKILLRVLKKIAAGDKLYQYVDDAQQALKQFKENQK